MTPLEALKTIEHAKVYYDIDHIDCIFEEGIITSVRLSIDKFGFDDEFQIIEDALLEQQAIERLPYRKQMEIEEKQLQERLSKIEKFMKTNTFKKLQKAQVYWLEQQKYFMKEYLKALQSRIEVEHILEREAKK